MSENDKPKSELPTMQPSQIETLSSIEERLRGKSLDALKQKAAALLDKVPHNPDLPEWDRL